MALLQQQVSHQLDIDYASYCLANFYGRTFEMKLANQAMGKQSLAEINRRDLVTTLSNLRGSLYVKSSRNVLFCRKSGRVKTKSVAIHCWKEFRVVGVVFVSH